MNAQALFLLQSLTVSLALTLVLELAFALVWGVRKKGLLLVGLMNLLTNPAVVTLHYLFSHRLGYSTVLLVILLEAAAILVEGLCCRGMIKRPWLFALLINLFSYGMGELLGGIL